MLFLTVLLIGAVSSCSSGSVVDKHGFEKTGTHNLTGNLFVTMAEVVAMQQQQQHKFEIALLAMKSQLEQKLSLSNDTLTPVVEWQQKYNDLKTNNIRLQHTYSHLLDKYIAIEKELILVRNQSSELNTKLGKVNNVKLEQDMHSLQQQVKSIGIKTYLLVSNDRNRNRDIAALYSKNADSEKKIASLVSETINNYDRIEHDQNVTVINMGRRFDDFSTRQTVAYDSLHKKIDEVDQSQNLTTTAINKQLEDYEIQTNMKVDWLLQRATQTNEKVALTACVSVDGFVSDHTLIRFDEVRTHVGIVDLAAVRNSGRFTCEKDGLYQISVVMNSPTANAQFSIHLNGNTVSTLRLSNDNNIDAGTSVVAADLQVGDIVWVQADSRFHVYFHWSCMTVVKVN